MTATGGTCATDYKLAAEQLNTFHVTVVPALDKDRLLLYHKSLWAEIACMPEYKTLDGPRVLGGFGALGNPSSFHNPTVRKLRMQMMLTIVPLLSPLAKGKALEQLIDRVSIRRKGTSPTAENWHGDVAPCPPSDDVFGGWVNLDLENTQRFSCVPGMLLKREHSGFVKPNAQEIEYCQQNKRLIDIPPGHLIIFRQHILHEVLAKKATFDSLRLYLVWRLTDQKEPLFNHTEIFAKQGVTFLPSGQVPPMYALTHMSRHKPMLLTWSNATFHPQCLENKIGADGVGYTVVHRHMASLAEYGFPLYTPYELPEFSLYVPNRQWLLPHANGSIIALRIH